MSYFFFAFVTVGILTALAVPFAGLLLFQLARRLVAPSNPRKAQKQINARVTMKEIQMMEKLGLAEGKGEISRAEYILLCSVRLGALSPELISSINYRFHALDTSGDGTLDYSELLHIPTEVIHAPKHSLTALLDQGYLKAGTARVTL